MNVGNKVMLRTCYREMYEVLIHVPLKMNEDFQSKTFGFILISNVLSLNKTFA